MNLFKSNKSEIIEKYGKAGDWCCERMWKFENGLTQEHEEDRNIDFFDEYFAE